MLIHIARHAWAYEYGDPRWSNDSQRPLEIEGAERYVRVVKALAERGMAPELIATSPYKRCVQTAELIAQYTQHTPVVIRNEALAPGGDFDAIMKWSRQAKCDSICWVGHSPDIGHMAGTLIGDGSADLRFAKGSIATIRMYSDLAPGGGELMWLATAKVLGL